MRRHFTSPRCISRASIYTQLARLPPQTHSLSVIRSHTACTSAAGGRQVAPPASWPSECARSWRRRLVAGATLFGRRSERRVVFIMSETLASGARDSPPVFTVIASRRRRTGVVGTSLQQPISMRQQPAAANQYEARPFPAL